jgi:hypothetical protein
MAKRPDKKPKGIWEELFPPTGRKGLDDAYLGVVWGKIWQATWVLAVTAVILYFLFGP